MRTNPVHIEAVNKLQSEGFKMVTGYRDVTTQFDVLIKQNTDRRQMADIAIVDVRTGWVSYSKVVDYPEPTDQEAREARSPTATNAMRHAYLIAAVNTESDTMVARHYVAEKIDVAFKSRTENDLVGRLDLQRREVYAQELANIRKGV